MLTSDPQDVRNNILLEPLDPESVYAGNKVYINKMPAVAGDPRYADVPVLRLSEVYLSAAEAAFQAGDLNKAASLLNDIISNRTTDASKQVTAANVTLDRIYTERRKELVGEGQRYFDAMRRGETIVRYTSDADKWMARCIDRRSQELRPQLEEGSSVDPCIRNECKPEHGSEPCLLIDIETEKAEGFFFCL